MFIAEWIQQTQYYHISMHITAQNEDDAANRNAYSLKTNMHLSCKVSICPGGAMSQIIINHAIGIDRLGIFIGRFKEYVSLLFGIY